MMIAVIATAAAFAHFSTFYQQQLADTSQRELTLDGVRGLAALMVAVHHAAIYRIGLDTGIWEDTHSLFPQLFGPAGVILFFMLTGYLFWGKARIANGWMNPWRLWRGRIYRIAPLYLFCLAWIVLAATIDQGASWLSPAHWQSLLRLLGLGAWSWHAIGHVYPGEYIANVVWTLWYEWRFYLLLPFIAWLALDKKIFHIRLALLALIAAGLYFDLKQSAALYFILGMLCSELLSYQSLRVLLQPPIVAGMALLTTLALYGLMRKQIPNVGPSDCLAFACFPLFLAAAAGNTFFGGLVHPAIRCLAIVSFSLYLLHGIVLSFVGFGFRHAQLNHLSPLAFWLVFIPVMMITTCLCMATYRWIEQPFLNLSHKSRGMRIKTDGNNIQDC